VSGHCADEGAQLQGDLHTIIEEHFDTVLHGIYPRE